MRVVHEHRAADRAARRAAAAGARGAPAYLVYHGDVAEAVIEGTGERLAYEEFARRYPRHGTLKAYLADEDGTCVMDAV